MVASGGRSAQEGPAWASLQEAAVWPGGGLRAGGLLRDPVPPDRRN